MGIFDFLTGGDAAKKAARINARATQDAIRAQEEAAARAEGYYAPYRGVGEDALNKLALFGGLRGREAQQSAYDDYLEGPDVAFLRSQGEQALTRRAAAGGHSQVAGRTIADAMKFSQGLASQSFGDYIRRITDLKDTGYGAAGGSAGIRANAGAGIANTIQRGGETAADYAYQHGMALPNLIGNTVGAGANLLGRWAEGGFKKPWSSAAPSSSSYTYATRGGVR